MTAVGAGRSRPTAVPGPTRPSGGGHGRSRPRSRDRRRRMDRLADARPLAHSFAVLGGNLEWAVRPAKRRQLAANLAHAVDRPPGSNRCARSFAARSSTRRGAPQTCCGRSAGLTSSGMHGRRGARARRRSSGERSRGGAGGGPRRWLGGRDRRARGRYAGSDDRGRRRQLAGVGDPARAPCRRFACRVRRAAAARVGAGASPRRGAARAR